MKFEVYECGDPYSRAWDCTEIGPHGSFYRGDISGRWGRTGLERYLRTTYPGCKIARRR